MRVRVAIANLLCCVVLLSGLASAPAVAADASRPNRGRIEPVRHDGLRFEPIVGQHAPGVEFSAQLPGGAAFLSSSGIAVVPDGGTDAVNLRFVGAARGCSPAGLDRVDGVSNYLLGSDPARWRSGVPGFSRVVYVGLYPGVDLILLGANGRLELGFDVAPNADISRIRFAPTGAFSVTVDATGDLVIEGPSGEMRLGAPRASEGSGLERRAIAGAYAVGPSGEIGFRVAARTLDQPLGLAPTIEYATLLGGSSNESAAGIAFGPDGSIYIAGSTTSADFPAPGSGGGARGGGQDLYVTKLNAAGTAIVYTTFIGGAGLEVAGGIDVDATGAVYVAGNSDSTNFPTVNPVQATNRGGADAVVTKLDATGANLVYSTYLGGGDFDRGNDVDADSTGAVVVGGVTYSRNFPVANAAQATFGGGASDGFVSILSPDGATLTSSTYVGGNGSDTLFTAKFEGGLVRLGGGSDSTDLPISSPARGVDACGLLRFMLLMDPIAAALTYLLLYPPDFADYCFDYVVAQAFYDLVDDVDWILAGGFLQAAGRGSSPNDVLCAALSPDGSQGRIVGFGGSDFDLANAVAVDSGGNIWVVGYTASSDFPVVNATQSTFGGGTLDAFVARVDPNTFQVVFATYLGGSGDENATDIKVDAAGNVVVVGSTSSSDFPTTAGALQPALAGGSDVFVVRFPSVLEPDFSLSLDQPSITAPIKSKGQIEVSIGRIGDFNGEVMVTPSSTSAIKVKLTPASISTTGGSVAFDYKVKKKATAGTYAITFTGRDNQGRERSATLSMTIQ